MGGVNPDRGRRDSLSGLQKNMSRTPGELSIGKRACSIWEQGTSNHSFRNGRSTVSIIRRGLQEERGSPGKKNFEKFFGEDVPDQRKGGQKKGGGTRKNADLMPVGFSMKRRRRDGEKRDLARRNGDRFGERHGKEGRAMVLCSYQRTAQEGPQIAENRV